MAERLRRAREKAGYRTATDAINKLKWPSSAYRAHENGQNNFRADTAEQYAEAYGVSAAWLLLGDGSKVRAPSTRAMMHKHNCVEHIRAVTLLLQDDPTNSDLIDKLDACVASLRAKAGRD